MRKFLLALVITMVILGACSTTTSFYRGSVYNTMTETSEDIRGTANISRLLLYKYVEMFGGGDIVTFDKFIQNDITLYTFFVLYQGADWRFIDELMIKIDDKLITLKDENPNRTTLRTQSGVFVEEQTHFVLDESTINDIKNCSSLVIQFYDKPVTIPQEGIDALKKFLE
jgi:hypothetical protein